MQDKGLRLVVSFADPEEGHLGTIYQAGNWIYAGRSPDAPYPIINGEVRHPKTLSDMIRDGRIKSRKDVEWITKAGKYRYLYPLDQEMRDKIERLRKEYPQELPQ